MKYILRVISCWVSKLGLEWLILKTVIFLCFLSNWVNHVYQIYIYLDILPCSNISQVSEIMSSKSFLLKMCNLSFINSSSNPSVMKDICNKRTVKINP